MPRSARSRASRRAATSRRPTPGPACATVAALHLRNFAGCARMEHCSRPGGRCTAGDMNRIAIAALVVCGLATTIRAEEREITVFAAASLREAFEDLGKTF